jgi:nucleoside-diphosphate-sugar epimerase
VVANNIRNFLNLLPKLHTHQKFIYASTIAVYNSGGKESLTEDHPLITMPANSYEFSKLECDKAMQLFPQIEYYGLRLATLSGVADNWRSDLMVNAMTDTAIHTDEVKVFNPQNNKPILYIQDLCRAIERIIDSSVDNRGFYNLASYNDITEEIAEAVVSVTNSKLTVIDSHAMTANGLPATAYDFIVSTKKFEETFNFKFEGNTENITKEIVTKIERLHASKRIDGKKYV